MKNLPIVILALSMFAGPAGLSAQGRGSRPQRPKLVVNIVVGGLRYDLLEKLQDNLSDEGFAKFAAEGTSFRAARYDYMQTLSSTGLATLTTGVNPSMHGIVSEAWIDYITGSRVDLVADDGVQGVGGDAGAQRYSPLHLAMPTVGDKLSSEVPAAKVVSIALDPASAIVAGGRTGKAYWMDADRAVWVSSTHYMDRLPDWVVIKNTSRPANLYIETGWTPARPAKQYMSTTNTIFAGGSGGRAARITSFSKGGSVDYAALMNSPVGNTLVADFASAVIEGEGLGADDATDVLNITLDASRRIAGRWGGGSMEVEDMIYRLDMDLGAMTRAIIGRVGENEVLFTLTSDHGMSDGWDEGATPRDRFNVPQFKTILNSFLAVQFGPGEWVLDYIDRQVYLNRNLMYTRGLSLEEVQNRAAAFVLQFRGVSHVLTSTALAGGYFGSGWGLKMQNSFYPRRAGDLMLNLMPDWIEELPDTKSLSGSMYDYDSHVPLLLWGWRIPPGRVVSAEVDMTALAPTLAHLVGIGRPIASDGRILPGIIDNND